MWPAGCGLGPRHKGGIIPPRWLELAASALQQRSKTILCPGNDPQDQAAVFDRYVIFATCPTDPSLFLPDVRPLVQDIIARHGAEEWKICLLTNEMHHHLGIYSIVGAKMGLKAREHLGAHFGSLQVTSFAGRQPPVSCFNDGLQLSTGSTLGRGNIAVTGEGPGRVEAHFALGDHGVKMRLKPEWRKRIADDIARGMELHGDLTPAYFDYVRELALRYWLEFDRHEVFELDPL